MHSSSNNSLESHGVDDSLPAALAERVRWLRSPAATTTTSGQIDAGQASAGQASAGQASAGEFVLYWMHHALRAHENPALDVAISIARQNGLPLLVYHALAEDYPFASDRHHAFILQGQRDVQRELSLRGIASCFHLERDGHRGPHLRDLTRRAAVLVTEEMPVQPVAGWMERLLHSTKTAIAMVDTSCVVAVPLVDKAYTRAFKFREATQPLYAQRVRRPYVEQAVDCAMYAGELPFKPLDLRDASLDSLIDRCKVDHSIAPVTDTPGGSQSGYARWDRFKEHGLPFYAKRRNDASLHDGVSRMSAYLHYGMVSPLRIAREAAELGAEKYLDELLIWRELAFHFCFHHVADLDSFAALPTWAQQTLQQHAADPREANYSWETLARAKTGQPLWDACQRSLLKQGELHNNVRMTWGKALLPWASTPNEAMQLTLDLNHRYALDGRDPSSYGGILWCFGQFDRPFSPERSIHGSIRPRGCAEHQRRLDLKRYCRIVDRPIADRMPRVAIAGAGIGGLIAARTLVDHGIDVTVFEKSRGVGGRLATRRVADELAIDHGAQYFTARDERFRRYVNSWIQDGLAQPWDGRIVALKPGGQIEKKADVPRFVGVPGMNSIAKHLARDLCIQLQTQISGLTRDNQGRWRVRDQDDNAYEAFDAVIANCPPPQAHAIIKGHTDLAARVASVSMRPCWAVLLCGKGLESVEFDGAFVNDGPLSWIARDGAKPGRHQRPGESTWILHASADWSEQHLECSKDQAQQTLLAAFESLVDQRVTEPSYLAAHRWRYAIPGDPLADECLWDAEAMIGVCGDWCGGPRVEGAFLSGMAIAGKLLRHLTIDRPKPLDANKMVQPSLL